jgi:hypothetical protein
MSRLFAPGATNNVVRSKVLTPVEAASLASGLRADAADLYYSAWVTFLDALHGINKGFYTWATVKLYYSVFYTFRASLAFGDVCAFHVDRTSFTVTARAGDAPVSCTERGTHKTVMKTFERRNPGHVLVSQQIDLEDAVDWMVEKRESANYRVVRFGEPDCEAEFEHVAANGLRRTLNAYLSETTLLYVFDPDHAIVAYPLRALQLVGSQLARGGIIVPSEDEQSFLRGRARDQAGNLPLLITEMERLNLLT